MRLLGTGFRERLGVVERVWEGAVEVYTPAFGGRRGYAAAYSPRQIMDILGWIGMGKECAHYHKNNRVFRLPLSGLSDPPKVCDGHSVRRRYVEVLVEHHLF